MRSIISRECLNNHMTNKIMTFLFISLASSSVFGALSGSVLFKGQVTRLVSLTVAAEASASSLDLSASKINLKVATINERSNSKTGYKMTIASANLGKLKRADGPELFTYSMKLGGSTVNLGQVAGATFIRNSTRPINRNRNLTISYIGKNPETMIEGAYADTLTITIAAR